MSWLGSALPGLVVVGSYRRAWLAPDLIAGVTVWAVLVPQALGYASLAGLPAAAGLYTALGALLLYWLWGSSRELNVGPESTVAIMVATVLTPMAARGSDEYVSLAVTLAILVGLVLLAGGLLRLGWIADLLSRPILAGYVFGSGLLIISSQLPALLGIDIEAGLYAIDMGGLLRNLERIDPTALALGLGSIAIVLGLRRVDRRIPGALVVVVGSIVLVALLDLGDTVEVVGSFPAGVPVPSLPGVGVDDVLMLVGPAFAIALLVYPDSVLTGRSLAVMGKYRLVPDREFYGVGAANIGAGLLGGFPVNGSQSRSYVMLSSGARSQVANLWVCALIVLTALFLAWVFDYLPTATLAGVVVIAGLSLLDPSDFGAIYRYRRSEFWMAVFTAAAVVIVGMLAGIIIAVALSLALVLQRAATPSTAILGHLRGTDTYRDVADHADAELTPGLLVYRFDAPLFFANASRLRDEIQAAVDEADPPVRCVVIDAEMMYDIDSTGAQILLESLDELEGHGIRMVLARVRTEVRDGLRNSGIEDRVGREHIYLEVDDAARAFEQLCA